MLGQKIGNYRLVRLLGTGGMGMVYESIHDGIGGRAAIKVLRPEIASNQDSTQRFFSEARAANLIDHPGIVHIFDCGYTPAGIAYLTMEFLEGETLRQRLDRLRVLSVSDALRLLRQVAVALQSAHARSVIHRDLKPDNLMLIRDSELAGGERVKILDFGIAKISEGLAEQTRTGMLMGTPAYMAPEQCRDAKLATDRSDVYSLGVILYQVLAGHPPFQGEYAGDVMAMQMMKEPVPIGSVCPWLQPAVATFVHRLLAKQPTVRPSMEEAARELQLLNDQITTGQTQTDGVGHNLSVPSIPSLPQRVSEPIARQESQSATPTFSSFTVYSSAPRALSGLGASVERANSTLTITSGQRQYPTRSRLVTSVAAGGVCLLGIGLYFGLTGRETERSIVPLSGGASFASTVPSVSKFHSVDAFAEESSTPAAIKTVDNSKASESTEKIELNLPQGKNSQEPWRDAYKALQTGAFLDAIRNGRDCEEYGTKRYKCTWIVGMAACKLLIITQDPAERSSLNQLWARSLERLHKQNQAVLADEVKQCIPEQAVAPVAAEPKPTPSSQSPPSVLPSGLKVPRFEIIPSPTLPGVVPTLPPDR